MYRPTDLKELAKSLRLLADRLEATETDMRIDIDVSCHGIETLDEAKAVAQLMDEVRSDSSRGSHWLRGTFNGQKNIDIIGHYKAGLFGKVRKKMVVASEAETDLSALRT